MITLICVLTLPVFREKSCWLTSEINCLIIGTIAVNVAKSSYREFPLRVMQNLLSVYTDISERCYKFVTNAK